MNLIESNEKFCCMFLYPAMQKETNMAVASRMTCKIGLIWRYMETLYSASTWSQKVKRSSVLGVFNVLHSMITL